MATLALAVAACSGGGDRQTRRPTATVPKSSATRPPATTVSRDDRPALNTTGTDWNTIVRSLYAFEGWTEQTAGIQPSVLDEIYQPGTRIYGEARRALEGRLNAGERIEGGVVEVLSVGPAKYITPIQVELNLIVRVPAFRLLGSNGEIIRQVRDGEPTHYLIDLVRGPGDRWRFSQKDCLECG